MNITRLSPYFCILTEIIKLIHCTIPCVLSSLKLDKLFFTPKGVLYVHVNKLKYFMWILVARILKYNFLPLFKNKRIRMVSYEAKIRQSFVSYVLVVQQQSEDLEIIPFFIDKLRDKISPLKYWMWFCNDTIKMKGRETDFISLCPIFLLHP